MMHTYNVSLLMWLSISGEICVLPWCAYKTLMANLVTNIVHVMNRCSWRHKWKHLMLMLIVATDYKHKGAMKLYCDMTCRDIFVHDMCITIKFLLWPSLGAEVPMFYHLLNSLLFFVYRKKLCCLAFLSCFIMFQAVTWS